MDYILHILILVSFSGILALSLNYVSGFGGIISVNHMTFYGVGAYCTALLMMNFDLPFLLALLMAVFLTGIIAFAVSFPILKLRGDSLILVSLGFASIGYSVFLNWESVTRGPLGISQIPHPAFFGIVFDTKIEFLVLGLFFLVMTWLILWWITESVYGVVMKSIREEETKASTLGYNARSYMRSIFVFGSLFAGLAGGLFATYFSVIEPKTFDLLPSVILLIMVIFGGLGNLKGSILGAVFIILVPEILRFLGLPSSIMAQLQQIIFGSAIVFLMFLRPHGVIGNYKM